MLKILETVSVVDQRNQYIKWYVCFFVVGYLRLDRSRTFQHLLYLALSIKIISYHVSIFSYKYFVYLQNNFLHFLSIYLLHKYAYISKTWWILWKVRIILMSFYSNSYTLWIMSQYFQLTCSIWLTQNKWRWDLPMIFNYIVKSMLSGWRKLSKISVCKKWKLA